MESLSYTGRDTEDIRQSLVDLVPKLTDKWKDFGESDLGMTIIELIAGAQDMQNFYLDNQTFETYLDTAMQEKNIRSILRAMNYRIPLMVNAKGRVTIEFSQELTESISIPQYTVFTCSEVEDVQYVSRLRTTVPSGTQKVEIEVEEGEVRTVTLSREELVKNLTSSNNVSRRIYLNDTNVADKSVKVSQKGYNTETQKEITNIWEECDDALLKYQGGRFYSVHKDSYGSVYILMSVNFLDLIPDDGTGEFIITYVRTNGTKGLVDAYQINGLPSASDILGEFNPGITVTNVYNEGATEGASNEPNLQLAKILAREHAQTLGRYITVDDYANGVATEPTVLFSVAKDWKTTDLVNRPFTVFIWAVNKQGENLSKEEQKSLLDKFKNKGISAVTVEYQETEFVYFDVEVKVTTKPITEAERVNLLGIIETYIRDSLAVEKIDYGGRLSISILTSSIYTLSPYLKSVVVETPDKDVESSEIQLLRLRNVTVKSED